MSNKKSGRNTPVSINLNLHAENSENIVDVIRGVYESIKARALEEGMRETEDPPLYYVKGGYRYMPDGYVLGVPHPDIEDYIVWERLTDERLFISKVLEIKERQLVITHLFNTITIENGWVRGVLK